MSGKLLYVQYIERNCLGGQGLFTNQSNDMKTNTGKFSLKIKENFPFVQARDYGIVSKGSRISV